jgi:hypothetical protein
MPKKTVEKLEVVEIKTYKCSDGSVYDTEEAALSHEQFLKDCDNNPLIASKIKELESRILALEAENATLSARITALEAKNSYPWSKPNPDVSPWGPYQQPFNPTAPTPKLPAEPGDIMYFSDKKQYSDKWVDLSKLSDEELMKKGYNVAYCGDKRCVLPPFENPLDKKVEINIDSVRGNATTPPDATPLEACSHDVINQPSVADEDWAECWKKNKKRVQ